MGADPSIADDTLLESSGPTQWESEVRGHAPESDLLDAMEFDLTIRDSDPDDVPHQVPLEQRAEHPRRRLVLVGGVEEVGDSDSTATLWGGEDDGGSVVSGIEEGGGHFGRGCASCAVGASRGIQIAGRGGCLPDFQAQSHRHEISSEVYPRPIQKCVEIDVARDRGRARGFRQVQS